VEVEVEVWRGRWEEKICHECPKMLKIISPRYLCLTKWPCSGIACNIRKREGNVMRKSRRNGRREEGGGREEGGNVDRRIKIHNFLPKAARSSKWRHLRPMAQRDGGRWRRRWR